MYKLKIKLLFGLANLLLPLIFIETILFQTSKTRKLHAKLMMRVAIFSLKQATKLIQQMLDRAKYDQIDTTTS